MERTQRWSLHPITQNVLSRPCIATLQRQVLAANTDDRYLNEYNTGINKQSIEEFIINEGVFADIAFDEGSDQQNCYFLEDEGDQEGHVYIFGCDEEDVHEVYEVYE